MDANKPASTTGETVLALVEETSRVGKRRVETGRVRISVATEAEEQLVHETLISERVEIERVALDRELAPGEPVPVTRREADGTLVVPVLEEVLVIERRLVLREEVRMRTVTTEATVDETVTLQRQHAQVERLPPVGADSEGAPNAPPATSGP